MSNSLPEKYSVTLAIPCFNAESYIKQTLDSISIQTVLPDEILIIDDGSHDRTAEIARQFPKVRLISHEHNSGIAASRNTAWQSTKNDILIYMDADGIADPYYIEKMLIPYSDDRVAGVCGHGIEAIQENIYDLWRKEILFQHWGDKSRDEIYFLFGLCSSYRPKVLKELGGFDPLFKISGEDMDMGFRILDAGYRLAYAHDAVVHHQRRDDRESITKMAYRHCFWGFLAQRKNGTTLNKMPFAASVMTFCRHLFIYGCFKGQIRFTFLSIRLHLLMAKAWLDARNSYNKMVYQNILPAKQSWEGHINP